MKILIKFAPAILLALITVNAQEEVASASALSEAQRKEMLETLKTLQDSHANAKMKRIQQGISALTPVTNNDNAAMALFENCQKKSFESNATSASEANSQWKEWRTRNKDELAKAANKRALRYQAKWALITLKAAQDSEEGFDPTKYASQAMSLMGEIINDDKNVLTEASGAFSSSMLTNVVGQFFELGACRPSNWPDNIMDFERVMDGLVIRPNRDNLNVSGVRKGFNDLISIQKRVAEMMKKSANANNNQNAGRGGPGGQGNRMNRRGGMGGRMDPNNFEVYASSQLWRCESACYEIGDQKTAAQNMFNIIRSTKDARQQEQYINQMEALLDGTAEEARKERELRRAAMQDMIEQRRATGQ